MFRPIYIVCQYVSIIVQLLINPPSEANNYYKKYEYPEKPNDDYIAIEIKDLR